MSLSLNYPTISPSLLLDFANSGRLDPQVTFTRASTATYFDETGTLQSAANNVPRFDYNPATLAAQGLLIEESRTNSIRNNTMQGAVAGTPGTAPTNWSVATGGLTGITQQIVGTGTESGITYLDIRFSGTPSAAGAYRIYTEGTVNVAALTGQTWTNSQYLKLAAGSLTGVSLFADVYQEFTSVGGFITEASVNISSPTAASLATQRGATSRTLAGGATTAFVRTGIQLSLTGAAIDITLRIGLPQLEQGAFTTSVIPTTTTALTRAADVASVNTLSPWFNAVEGTLFAEAQKIYSGSSGFPRLVQISDASNNNSITALWADSLGRLYGAVTAAGATQADIGNNGLTQTAIHKTAFSYKTNDFAISNDGASVVTDTSGTVPTVDRMFIGKDAGTTFLNGYLRRIAFYPVRLSNAQLQAITA